MSTSGDTILPTFVPVSDSYQVSVADQTTMTSIGTYDAPVVDFDPPKTVEFTEEEWKQKMAEGGLTSSLPIATVDFVEDPSALRVQIQTSIMLDPSDRLQVYSEQIIAFSEKISTTYTQIYDGEIKFVLDLNVLPYYLDFLRPGETLKISAITFISDGVTTLASSPSLFTITGINQPISLNPDHAIVMQGQMIEVASVGSVLDNDEDPDGQGAMTVLGVASTVQDTVGILPDGSLASIEGQFGTLQIDNLGNYGYVPFPEYRYTLDNLTDVFQYSAINEAIDANWGELTIEILPDPEVKILVPMENSFFVLDDGLAVIGGSQPIDMGYSRVTPLGNFFIESLSDSLLEFDISFEGFSITSPFGQDIFFSAVLNTAFITPRVELFELTQPDERIWVANCIVRLESQTDFQFLNDNEIVTLTYVIRGADQKPYSSTQSFQVAIQGENDTPVAADDYNLVYAGHSAVGVSGAVSGLLFNDYDVDFNDWIHVSAIRFGETSASFTSQIPSPFDPLTLEGNYGSLTVYAGGDYTYTANKAAAQFIEPVSDIVDPTFEIFTYRVADTAGDWDEKQLIIQVLGPSDKPTAIDDNFEVYLGSDDLPESVFNLFDNDIDTDPSRLLLASTTNFPLDFLEIDDYGNVFIRALTLEYLKSGQELNLFFDYTVGNGAAESDPASVYVRIYGKNEVPHGYDDVYFYENMEGSVLNISADDGLILRVDISTETADSDIDGDLLMITAISETTLDSGSPVTWMMLDNGLANLNLPGGISIIVHSDGSFEMDTPDGYIGTVEFAYLLSDGLDVFGAKATVIVGGPGSLDGDLIINEISLMNGAVVRNVYTDNGAAPNRILVGAASIELLNTSDEAISAASLSALKLEIIGPEGSIATISFGALTGLTMDADGEALNKLSIPAGGVLMLYEPGTLGLGTWALYGPNKHFISGASGSYAGQAWSVGDTTKEALAVNLVQGGTSLDFFAANGADIDGLTGIIGLGDRDQGEQGMSGVPWAGDDVGTLADEQYDGSTSSTADTVFGRTSFTDTDSEQDWSHYVSQARTVGSTNTKLYRGSVLFVANPEDPTENLNPNQGQSTSEGQSKQMGSGSLVGGGGYDVLVGQEGTDSLFGDELDDALHGGGGNDSLDGGSGGDWLEGGAGADQLAGGSGDDTFVFADVSDSGAQVRDSILDFTVGADRIDVSMIDANAAHQGDQAFQWGGSVAGRAQAVTMVGMLVFWVENGMTVVQADAAGDNFAPLELLINSIKALSAADFVL